MGKENRFIRALPLTPGNLLEAFLDSPVIKTHRIRIGRMVGESTAEIPHIITHPTIVEDIRFVGDNSPKPGTRVVIYNAS